MPREAGRKQTLNLPRADGGICGDWVWGGEYWVLIWGCVQGVYWECYVGVYGPGYLR